MSPCWNRTSEHTAARVYSASILAYPACVARRTLISPACIALCTLAYPACLARSAQKTADPFLNADLNSPGIDKKAQSSPGVACGATIQALFKRGSFLECAKPSKRIAGKAERLQVRARSLNQATLAESQLCVINHRLVLVHGAP